MGFYSKRVLVREAMSEIITSKENPAVKHAARLLKSAKFRRQEEAFLAEGVRLCRDAAYSGVRESSASIFAFAPSTLTVEKAILTFN